ncbi:hypothetical protein COO60DRAFT_1643805 [Scenedesmus sp. NREL 46B-D3]|nr:hypothetical protein COO60DRAFT_1643805 [Scenedesmus sp. NREL 46B-D3]
MATPPNAACSLVRTVTPLPTTPRHEKVHITDAELLGLIDADTSLSIHTRHKYVATLKGLTMGRGPTSPPLIGNDASLLWVAMHPEQATELLTRELSRRGIYSAHNVHNHIQPIRAMMARHPYLAKLTAMREQWREAVTALSVTPLAEEAKANRPNKRQADGFVPYAEIRAMFAKLCEQELGSRDSLIVGLMALADENLFPQRVDYGKVKLYCNTQEPATDAAGNYLVLQQHGNGKCEGYLVLNEYKTAKTYGRKRMQLPACYIKTLLESLVKQPRSWLFTKQTGPPDRPYDNDTCFGNNVNKRLKELFGRPLTVSGVRHSCITHMHCSSKWAHLSDAEREAVAHEMSHSFAMACRYRFVPHAVGMRVELVEH